MSESDDVRYFYYRDAARRPMITLCRVVIGLVCSYGWAICSSTDNPNKRIGRALAKERALEAITDPRAGGIILGIVDGASVWCYGRPVKRADAYKLARECCSVGNAPLTLLYFLQGSSGVSLYLRPTALQREGFAPTMLPRSMLPVVKRPPRRISPIPSAVTEAFHDPAP